MAEFVEGDWKNFTFKMAKPEDYPGILDHLRQNFYKDEPQNKMLGQSEQKTKDMDTMAMFYLEQNLSFFVVDRDNNNKIIGARVTGIARKDDDPLKLFKLLESEELLELFPNIGVLLEEANSFAKLGIDHYGDFFFVSVDRAYRGHGLAQEIYQRAIKMLKAQGVPAVQSIFSNPASQAIVRKLGFTELARLKMKDYKKSDGSVLFPQATDDDVAIVMAKMI